METNTEKDRNRSIVEKLKNQLDKFKSLAEILKLTSSPDHSEHACQMIEAADQLYSLITNDPVNDYGLSLENMLCLAESQIKTAKDNVDLQETNEVLREYIIGLEKRLENASQETMQYLKKKGF